MGEWEGRGALPLVAGGGINADTELVFGSGAAACAFHLSFETRPRKFVVDLSTGNGTLISGLSNEIGSWRIPPALLIYWPAPDLELVPSLAANADRQGHGLDASSSIHIKTTSDIFKL